MDGIHNASEVVSFDAEAARDAALEATQTTLYAVVEYDPSEYNVLYAGPELRAFYEDDEQMYSHFSRIHSYVHVDFMERELFEDSLFPGLGEVEAFVTRMEALTLIRYLHGSQGLFLSVDADEQVNAVVDAVTEAI